MAYDQFILSLHQGLGVHACRQQIANAKTFEHKLYQAYQEHIHLLHINKKIRDSVPY